MLRPNTRVALRRDPSWTGTVHAVHGDVAVVFGDIGWSGKFTEADLIVVDDKAWPPARIETK